MNTGSEGLTKEAQSALLYLAGPMSAVHICYKTELWDGKVTDEDYQKFLVESNKDEDPDNQAFERAADAEVRRNISILQQVPIVRANVERLSRNDPATEFNRAIVHVWSCQPPEFMEVFKTPLCMITRVVEKLWSDDRKTLHRYISKVKDDKTPRNPRVTAWFKRLMELYGDPEIADTEPSMFDAIVNVLHKLVPRLHPIGAFEMGLRHSRLFCESVNKSIGLPITDDSLRAANYYVLMVFGGDLNIKETQPSAASIHLSQYLDLEGW
jgi:hypothetical protein